MGRRSVTLVLTVLLATAGLARVARAEESGKWEADRRGTLREELSRSMEDIGTFSPRLYWERGPILETPKKAISIHVGYEGQFDAVWYSDMDDAVEAAAGASWLSGFKIRRSRVGLEAFVLRHWFIRARYGVSGFDSFEFQDLFVEWSGLTDLKAAWMPVIRVGQVKEAMTIDWMNNALRTTFAERAMFTTTIVPNRNPGIRLHGQALDERLTYQAGAYLVNAASLNDRDEGEGESYTARVTGLVWDPRDRPGRLLHLGLSAALRYGIGNYDVGAKPESWVGPNVIQTGEYDASRARVVAGEFFWQHDRLSVTAEGAWNHVQLPDGTGIDYWGCYGTVSYFLTNDHIPYNRKLGCYGRVRPERTLFCPRKSGMGAWEVAARWSILDLDDGPAPGGRAWNATLGLNWYMRDNMRVIANFIHTNVTNAYGVAGADGTMNAIVVRFAYDL